MDRLQKNQIYTGTVEGYSSEGLGIVRLDGAVVFLPGAVRGETVDLQITKVMKTAAAGEIVRIRVPSPDRAAPECPWYGQCGGCDFQHLTYPEELRAKRQRVRWRRSWGRRTPPTTATRASTRWARTAPSASTGPGPIRWCR